MLKLSDPRIYVATGASPSTTASDRSRIFLTETLQYGSYAPDFVWKPENLSTRPQVWQVQLTSFQATPIAFESFQSFNPEPQQEVSKPLPPDRFPQLKLAGTDTIRTSFSVEPIVPEVRGYTNQGQQYAIALSISDYRPSTRQEYFSGWEGYPFHIGKSGWQTVTYYSGLFHLEVFDVANPTQPVIYLQKQVKNWTQYPKIANFGEVILLPNGKSCLIVNRDPYLSQDLTSGLIVF